MFALPAEGKVDVHKRNGRHLLSNLWFTKTHLGSQNKYIHNMKKTIRLLPIELVFLPVGAHYLIFLLLLSDIVSLNLVHYSSTCVLHIKTFILLLIKHVQCIQICKEIAIRNLHLVKVW